jgi:hypothetical protein
MRAEATEFEFHVPDGPLVKVHWSSSADVLPECNPRGADLRDITSDISKVTCKVCLKILARTYNVDLSCGACAGQFYTGSGLGTHTCVSRPKGAV